MLIWDGNFPGSSAFVDRLFIVHVFIVPVIIMGLIGLHLAIIMRQKHSQFPGPGRTERNVVGTPLWPAYTFRALGMLLATAAVLFLLGGLVQINPVWQYGPYETWLGTNGAQPDWYMGWLIGALRLMPGFDFTIGDATIAGNPFFGGILFPGVVFTVLYMWPAIERRITKDKRRHDLLDRPRDKPWRTAFGAAFFTWIFTIFVAGAADRILVDVGFPYEGQVIFFRILALVLPVVVFIAVYFVCRELKRSEARPLRHWYGTVVRRRRRRQLRGDTGRDRPRGRQRQRERPVADGGREGRVGLGGGGQQPELGEELDLIEVHGVPHDAAVRGGEHVRERQRERVAARRRLALRCAHRRGEGARQRALDGDAVPLLDRRHDLQAGVGRRALDALGELAPGRQRGVGLVGREALARGGEVGCVEARVEAVDQVAPRAHSGCRPA